MTTVVDIQNRLKLKKKRRKRRRRIALLILLVTVIVTFMIKSPYFIIDNIEVIGMEKIPIQLIDDEIKAIKGNNIFLFRSSEIKEILSYQEYFSQIKIKRKFPSEIIINIQEKKPEINYIQNGIISLLTEDGTLLEIGANQIEDGSTLIDDVALPSIGENIYKDQEEKRVFLAEFRDLQKRNISDIKIDTINMTNMENITSKYNNLEIRLGYRDSLKSKLNKSINIIEEGLLENESGYIDVSVPDNPVIFIK